jgi:hypothetical protein
MVSLGCTLHEFQMLLPEDGGRPSKHVAGKFVRIHTVRVLSAYSWFLNNIKYNKLHGMNIINISFCFSFLLLKPGSKEKYLHFVFRRLNGNKWPFTTRNVTDRIPSTYV